MVKKIVKCEKIVCKNPDCNNKFLPGSNHKEYCNTKCRGDHYIKLKRENKK
jgi:hypothetical protein